METISGDLAHPIAQMLGMLLLILASSELFTNALEHLGDGLGISEGVTGSLFAAVGTALPETIVPLLALTSADTGGRVNVDIGTGAILGAPLMLSTLSTFLMAASVIAARGWRGRVQPEASGLRRDLDFFLLAFAIATASMFVPPDWQALRQLAAVSLLLTYFIYLLLTLRASQRLVAQGHGTQAHAALWLQRLGLPGGAALQLLQLALSVALLVFAARGFIDGVSAVSHRLGVSALVIALLVVPIATELPEKVNSILWLRRGKDTLAMGNITGALVFQGSLLPAIGILLTPWQPQSPALAGLLVTWIAVAWLRLNARADGVALRALMLNGALYAGYLAWTLRTA